MRQLEDEVDRVAVNGVNGGMDEVRTNEKEIDNDNEIKGEKLRMEEELKEEKENNMRLKKEIKRLEDMCDNFDDIEYK